MIAIKLEKLNFVEIYDTIMLNYQSIKANLEKIVRRDEADDEKSLDLDLGIYNSGSDSFQENEPGPTSSIPARQTKKPGWTKVRPMGHVN